MRFESKFSKIDVTAIKIHGNHVLAGIGGHLEVFDKKTLKLLKRHEIFPGENICGIVPNDVSELLVHSGTQVKILEVKENFAKLTVRSFTVCRDWILEAKWTENCKNILSVFMHNNVEKWNQDLRVENEYECEERCILYSAFLYNRNHKETIVFSGTVFSEILIWRLINGATGRSPVLRRLQGHKGVIFSLHYNPVAGYICSSSDDRSAIIWKLEVKSLDRSEIKADADIDKLRVYGHSSRVFRCKVLNDTFVTAGEDSILNIWSLDGQLMSKIETHQGGPVWAVDVEEKCNLIVTGGADCGVVAFPIRTDVLETTLKLPGEDGPKTVGILDSDNFVAFSQSGVLYYFLQSAGMWAKVGIMEDLRRYVLLQVSKCRKLVALSGIDGQIYIYKEEDDELNPFSFYQSATKSRIFSFHWLTCESFLICQNEGLLALYCMKNKDVIPVVKFSLPLSKERWTTTAVLFNNKVVVGDRRGNLHLFKVGGVNPLQTLKKVHNHLGVAKLVVSEKRVSSLGRDATIKTFLLVEDKLVLSTCDKLRFTWLLDIIGDIVLAFSGNNFVMWHHASKRLLFEKICGGGHRSWDFRLNSNRTTFMYVKDEVINVASFGLHALLPVNLVEGYHLREVNAVEVIEDSGDYFVVSGGEDTTLRITLAKEGSSSNQNLLILKSHLSSIRAITSYRTDARPASYLIFSAGGRAQIICWKLDLLCTNAAQNVDCTEQHSYYKPIDCEDAETRIMDLVVTEIDRRVVLFCACSDGNVKVFSVQRNAGSYRLRFCRDLFYKLKCVLKVMTFEVMGRNVLLSTATDGLLSFWDVSEVFAENEISPFASVESNRSGINSCACRMLTDDTCVLVTGGDDNAIVVSLVRYSKSESGRLAVAVLNRFVDDGAHCAQITGVYLTEKYFITASVDQRIIVFKWEITGTNVNCRLVSRHETSVSDVQGLQCFTKQNGFSLFVYGNGLEYYRIEQDT